MPDAWWMEPKERDGSEQRMIVSFVVWWTVTRRASLCGVLLVIGLVLTLRSVAAEEVTVFPLQGSSFSGKLMRLDSSGIVVESSGTSQNLPLDQLRRMDFVEAASAPAAFGPIAITLTDGSLLRAERFTTADSQAVVGRGDEQELTVPTRAIARVALRDYGNDEGLRNRWTALAGDTYRQDTLIYRREADGIVSLDTLQGVLYDVGADNVDFLFDGERISPRRERIDGLVYFHPPRSGQDRPALCLVHDRSGSQWRAARLNFLDDQLELESIAGVRVVLPPSEIKYLDFAAGNLVYLSELEPESATWRPFFESRISEELLERRYAPRRDQAFDGGPLRILGETYEKGLALRSHSTLVFRVGSEFRRFQSRVAMDDLARNSAVTSSVMFTVAGDDKVLWEGEVRSTDPPIDLDLEIMGVRRLKITVDFGDDLDIADFLDLADARFTK